VICFDPACDGAFLYWFFSWKGPILLKGRVFFPVYFLLSFLNCFCSDTTLSKSSACLWRSCCFNGIVFIWAWNQAHCIWELLTSSGVRIWDFFFPFFFSFYLPFPAYFFFGGGGVSMVLIQYCQYYLTISDYSVSFHTALLHVLLCSMSPCLWYLPCPRAPATFPVTHLQAPERLPCYLSDICKLSNSIHLFRFSCF